MSRPLMETYHGLVRTPVDAIKLFEACRLGILPRVQRRLSEKERQAIRSGSVFVWDEREAGMRRWTDGKSWSASRVSGSFLTYREMEGKRYREMEGKKGGNAGSQRRGGAGRTPDSGRGSDEDQDEGEPGGYRYKADGLMKQSFSITTSNGQHLHLISYFTKSHSQSSELLEPSTDAQLRSIVPPKGLYPESSWNDSSSLPALTRGPMAGPGQYMMAQQQHGQQQYPPQQYAAAPQHQHQQQQQQQQQQQPQGYSWPLSPVATPPYATNGGHSQQHYTTSPYPPQSQPHHTPHQPAATQHHAQSQPPPPPTNYPTQYSSSNRLPPPAALLQQAPQQQQAAAQMGHAPPPHHSPHAQYEQYQPRPQYQPPPRVESPRSAHLQAAAAQAVMNAARNPQPTPPMLYASTATKTPPNRALSVSPPRSSHSEAASVAASTAASSLGSTNKASLSALLHPTPSNSEPGSANPCTGSAGSSPRGMDNTGMSEDARAIRVLDRNFGL